MRSFWTAAEWLDLTTIRLLDTIDRFLGRKPFGERIRAITDRVPEPTGAPKREK